MTRSPNTVTTLSLNNAKPHFGKDRRSPAPISGTNTHNNPAALNSVDRNRGLINNPVT